MSEEAAATVTQPDRQAAPTVPSGQHHDTADAEHEKAMRLAFERSQSVKYAQWDLWAGVSLSALLLLALRSSLQRQHWRIQLAAFMAEVTFRVLPVCLATLARASYIPYRTPIVAACRLASEVVPRLVVQPPLRASSWGGWPQFLLFTRALGVNTLPWLARLPLKWFVWVHLIAVADATRASLDTVCTSPAFSSAAAQGQYVVLARFARFLALVAPMPNPQGRASCLDAVMAAAPGGALGPEGGTCACRQTVTWLLGCLGYAFPLACQYLAEVTGRRQFYRQRCRRAGCAGCATAKGADLPLLAASALLLLVGFCAGYWQLVANLYLAPPDAGPAATGEAG